VGRIHRATDLIPPHIPRRVTFEIPGRADFFDSLENLDSPWRGGPYSEPMRELLRAKGLAIRGLFDTYDGIVREVAALEGPWVITHGEPHAANVMRPHSGGILLIDWDTAALAPPERDLWMVDPGSTEADQAAIELYRLFWALSEITGYTATFRAPHADDANTRTAWEGLKGYLPD
jgi:spectinomycin phosphotransferase